MKLLIDMNLSPEWREVFRQAGWESVHWSQVSAPNAPDAELMEWARVHGHVVFTHDLDFGALLASTGAVAPSVVQMRGEDTRPGTMGVMVAAAIHTSLKDLIAGALVTIHPRRMRITILPLKAPDI